MNQQQRPTQRPAQKPPQRSPQRTPDRPPQRPSPGQPQKQTSTSRYGTAFFVILMSTVALLVISLIILCVALAISGNDTNDRNDDPAGNVQNDGNGEQQKNNNTSAKKDGVATNASRENYNIGNASSYQQISGISSDYAILVDLDHFQAIAGINPDTRICPASMTKVMTVLVACENLGSLKDQVKVADAVKIMNGDSRYAEASGLDWQGGETVSVEDLLYLIYYRSDTVACLAMCQYIAGSETAFVKLMNDKAKSMGLTNTKFSNSSGLDFEGEEYYTTCREMAAIMAYALENPLASKIMKQTGTWYLPEGAPVDRIRPTWITDRFGDNTTLDTVTLKAAKTGWEDAAGACLVSYAEGNGGKQYIQVIVGGSVSSAATCTTDVKHIYNTYAN